MRVRQEVKQGDVLRMMFLNPMPIDHMPWPAKWGDTAATPASSPAGPRVTVYDGGKPRAPTPVEEAAAQAHAKAQFAANWAAETGSSPAAISWWLSR